MPRYFITRHPGALDWARRHGHVFEVHLSHLPEDQVLHAGDVVAGTLPVNKAADLHAAGVVYWHLSLDLPESMRGRELSADDLDACGARLERFDVVRRSD